MQKKIIGFLGAGNMGQSLIKGLILNGYPAELLWVCDKHKDKLNDLLVSHPKINITQDMHSLVTNTQVLVLAIKPQVLQSVITDLKTDLQQYTPLLISIAAGIKTQQINTWLSNPLNTISIIRAMPNTPALLQVGITGLYADTTVSQQNKKLADQLFGAVGQTIWIEDEHLMDVITALSGSGPAYFFYILEALIQGATQLGLPHKIAQKLSIYTMLGASEMALHSDDLSTLRQKVTSPGGTTEAGLAALNKGQLKNCLIQALIAATERGQALSNAYDTI